MEKPLKCSKYFIIIMVLSSLISLMICYNSAIEKVAKSPTIYRTSTRGRRDTIYLLLWNESSRLTPFKKETSSKADLISRNCRFTNCIFTNNMKLLPNIEDFDGIFISPFFKETFSFPNTRSPHQLYGLITQE